MSNHPRALGQDRGQSSEIPQYALSTGLAAEALQLERRISDLVNEAYALTPAEIALMWQTAPPRMPFSPAAEEMIR